MTVFARDHNTFVQETAKRISFTLKESLKQAPEVVLLLSHTLESQILHEVALDMFIDWKRIHLCLISGDLQSSTSENSCLAWLAKVLLESPRVEPKSIIAPQVDLHGQIKVNEFYNVADLGYDTLGVYMPIQQKVNDADSTIAEDEFDFDKSINQARAEMQKIYESEQGYNELENNNYDDVRVAQTDNLTSFINSQTAKKSILNNAQVKILPTISQFKTEYDEAVAAAARKVEKLISIGFPVILIGSADVDSFCGCVDEQGVIVCKESVFRAGKKVLERANEIICTFDENEMYEFYQENKKQYSSYVQNNYCFVGVVE